MSSSLIIIRSFFSKRVSALSRVSMEIAVALSNKGHKVEILTDVNKTQKVKRHLDSTIPIRTVDDLGVLKTYREFLKYYKNHNYQYMFLHTSLVGLVFYYIANINKIRLIRNTSVILYNYKPQLDDFNEIEVQEYANYWRRIFLRNFFYGVFIPKFVIRFLLRSFKHVYTPSNRLTEIYSNYTDRVSTLNFGIYNNLKCTETNEEYELLDNIKQHKNKETTVLVHSGLATPFRGWKYATQLINSIKDSKVILYLLLYADPDEAISEIDISLATKIAENSNNKIILISKPLMNIDRILSYADIAIYQYRYIGDIPECPLTINELQNQGVVVFSNRLGGLSDMIPEEIPMLTGVCDQDAKTLCNMINRLDYFKKILSDNILQHSWDSAALQYINHSTDK